MPSVVRSRWWRRLGARALLVLVGAVAVSEFSATLVMTVNLRGSTPGPPTELSVAAASQGGIRAIEIVGTDGMVLRGEVMGDPSTRPAVIFAHGYRNTRRNGDRLAQRLLEQGYSVVSFDFRGSGSSQGVLTGGGAVEGADVVAVARAVRDRFKVAPSRTAIVGFSMGAVAVIEAAPHLSTLAGVVLIAPYANLEETIDARTRRWLHVPARPLLSPALWAASVLLGVDPRKVLPEQHVGQLSPSPLLLVGSSRDWRAPTDVIERIRRCAGDPKETLVLDGLTHDELGRFPPALGDPILTFLEHAFADVPPPETTPNSEAR